MTDQTPLPGIDPGLPAAKDRGPIIMTDDELKDMADALWRIRDLAKAGHQILGFSPPMMELQDTPAHDGLWGILGGIQRLVDQAVKPIERNL